MNPLPLFNAPLVLTPEVNIEEITVVLAEDGFQMAGEGHEVWELFGENIIFIDVEPGLGGQLVVRVPCLGEATEVAGREGAQLVVIVENDPAVSRHPKIL